MKFRSQSILVVMVSILLSHCIAPQHPLKGIDIPEPANADAGYYFFRGAKAVIFKQEDQLAQARIDLEQVIKSDQRILYPEAYPYLVEVYNRLGISDSSAWIYPDALLKMEADPQLTKHFSQRFGEWQKAYPAFPPEFLDKDYKLLDSGVEPAGGYQYLYRILEYPEMAREMNRTGISWYSFIVEADGTLTDVQLLKSSYPDLDEAGLKAINACTWEAAQYHGRPVAFQVTLPIQFKL